MPLACGCEIKPGVPLGAKELKTHYKHTIESMFFWQLMRRENTVQDERHIKLSQAVADFIEALDALYPEAQTE